MTIQKYRLSIATNRLEDFYSHNQEQIKAKSIKLLRSPQVDTHLMDDIDVTIEAISVHILNSANALCNCTVK